MNSTHDESVSDAMLTFLLHSAIPASLTAQQRADAAARLLTSLLFSIAMFVWIVNVQLTLSRIL